MQSIGRDGYQGYHLHRGQQRWRIRHTRSAQGAIRDALGYDHVDINHDVAKVSVVGGMVDNPGVAATMFEALYEAHINIMMISTSEIKVSVLINEEDTDRAVSAIHAKFFQ